MTGGLGMASGATLGAGGVSAHLALAPDVHLGQLVTARILPTSRGRYSRVSCSFGTYQLEPPCVE